MLVWRPYVYPVLGYRVVDGDSIEVRFDRGWSRYGDLCLYCRVVSVDAPERHTEAGKLVKAVVERWFADRDEELLSGHLLVESIDRDKYRDRFTGNLFTFKEPKQTLSGYLLGHGLAKVYFNRKREWSKEDLDRVSERCRELVPGLQVNELDGCSGETNLY